MAVVTLVCSCGMRMKAPGAVPGRVGKCPRCGSMLKVPEAPAFPNPAPLIESEQPSPRPDRATFVKHRARSRKQPAPSKIHSDGLVKSPKVAETRFSDSLTYPLWNDSGVAVLVFMPPLLWIGTAPLVGLYRTATGGNGLSLIGLVLLLPQILLLMVVGGYILLFLGQVLVTSALGEVAQPRSPSWDLDEIARGLGRWFWAMVVGLVVGGTPALAYWIGCGSVDWLDRIVLVDLIVPGLSYAQMALLAALIHDSPLAANPITVLRAILRIGWPYAMPCIMTGSALVLLSALFGLVLRISNPFGQVVAFWAFWVVALYGAMVVLRRLGLFCYQHAVILEWFPGRSWPAP